MIGWDNLWFAFANRLLIRGRCIQVLIAMAIEEMEEEVLYET